MRLRVLAPEWSKGSVEARHRGQTGRRGQHRTLEVARAEPDGHTILVAAAGNFVINQFLMRMSFDRWRH